VIDIINEESDAIIVTESCPISTAADAASRAPGETASKGATILETAYAFRDDVLRQHPAGAEYVDLYYEHATEGIALLVRHPRLMAQVLDVLARALPTLEAMTDGEPASIGATDLRAIDRLLGEIVRVSSPEMKTAVRHLQRDMQSGALLSTFGVSVDLGGADD
jgi:hypothetical protein